MTYETAKKLYDSGFPRTEANIRKSNIEPTLEELIEACGQHLEGLWKTDKGEWWGAWHKKGLVTTTPRFKDLDELLVHIWLAIKNT